MKLNRLLTRIYLPIYQSISFLNQKKRNKLNCSFIILTWNRKYFIEKGIPALIKNIIDKKSCEIIIMDNASTDGTQKTLEEIRNLYSKEIEIKIISNKKNLGLNGYKKLFLKAKGKLIIEVDDDVIDFPENIDQIFLEYFNNFKDYGYLALDVIQNEHTNGAKPPIEDYTEEERNGLVIQEGPTGGWCAGIRYKDFYHKKILYKFLANNYDFKNGEDGYIHFILQRYLGLKGGIIKDKKCFHASGPYYSKLFGALERDIEKYESSGLNNYTNLYKEYR